MIKTKMMLRWKKETRLTWFGFITAKPLICFLIDTLVSQQLIDLGALTAKVLRLSCNHRLHRRRPLRWLATCQLRTSLSFKMHKRTCFCFIEAKFDSDVVTMMLRGDVLSNC